jgi:hypothetical protein
MHGGAESCMFAAGKVACKCCNGSEDGAGTVVSPVLRKVGTIMLWNGLENGCPEPYARPMLVCTGAGLAIQ